MDVGARTRADEGGVRVCVRAGEQKGGAPGRQLRPWWARAEKENQEDCFGGEGA